jgi:hypothetical protein
LDVERTLLRLAGCPRPCPRTRSASGVRPPHQPHKRLSHRMVGMNSPRVYRVRPAPFLQACISWHTVCNQESAPSPTPEARVQDDDERDR